MGALPSFEELLGPGGETVEILVHLDGIQRGQIDFERFHDTGRGVFPHLVHREVFEGGGPVRITAPAHLDEPLYVGVVDYGSTEVGEGVEELRDYVGRDDRPPEGRGFCGFPEPVTLDGEDLILRMDRELIPEWHEAQRHTEVRGMPGAPPSRAASPPPAGSPQHG